MHCQRVVLVGDAHLGRGSSEAEGAFLAFLDTVPALGDGLVVTGDLFEFWFVYGRAVPRRGVRVVSALAALRRKVPILMVGGNHDRWAGTFWDELGIEFAALEAPFELNGRRALVVHGDGITEAHWSARILHRLLRHQGTVALYRALHPDLGFWLVDRLSGYLGDRDRTEAEIAASAARQERWARERLREPDELSLLVMGHTHRPVAVETQPGRLYVNPGAWFDGYRYAVIGEGGASLAQFDF